MTQIRESLNVDDETNQTVARTVVTTMVGLTLLMSIDTASVLTQDDRQAVPVGTCTSPLFEVSHAGDPGAHKDSQYYAGRSGLVMHALTGEHSIGIRGAFRSHGDKVWTFSSMLPVGTLGQKTLDFAIGEGDVDFGVQQIAPAGSPDCVSPPTVSVEEEGPGIFRSRPGESPWLNIDELLVNVGIPHPDS